jgi:hypothetical protein
MDGRVDGEDQGGGGHTPHGHGGLPPGLWDCPACGLDCITTRELFSHVSWGPCSRQIGQTLVEFKAMFRKKQKRKMYEKNQEQEREKRRKLYQQNTEQERKRKRVAVSFFYPITHKYIFSSLLDLIFQSADGGEAGISTT